MRKNRFTYNAPLPVRTLSTRRGVQPSRSGVFAQLDSSVAALVTLRQKVIKPLLAAAGKLKTGRKPKNHGALDVHYESIQRDMQALFTTLGIAA
jgi:hypothetical protein